MSIPATTRQSHFPVTCFELSRMQMLHGRAFTLLHKLHAHAGQTTEIKVDEKPSLRTARILHNAGLSSFLPPPQLEDSPAYEAFFAMDYEDLMRAIKDKNAQTVRVIMKSYHSDCFFYDDLFTAVASSSSQIQSTFIRAIDHDDLFEILFSPRHQIFSDLLELENVDSFIKLLFEQFSSEEMWEAAVVTTEDDDDEPVYNLYDATCTGSFETVTLFLKKLSLDGRLRLATEDVPDKSWVCTCIFYAAMERGPSFIAAFLEGMLPQQIEEFLHRGSDDGQRGFSFVHRAVATANREALTYFFEVLPPESRCQVPLWESDPEGTVLSVAMNKGNDEIVQYLRNQLANK